MYLFFWEETPLSIFPNIHIKWRIFRRDFLLQLQEGDAIFVMKCKSLFLDNQKVPFSPGEWNVTCWDNDYMNVVMNAQAHLAHSLWACFMYECPDASIWGQELMETGTAVSCRSSDKLTAPTYHGKWKTT